MIKMVKPLFTYTGDPFVDGGIFGVTAWLEKDRPEDVEKEDIKSIIPEIANLYVRKGWGKALYRIFPNNKITNPSIPKEKREEEFSSFLKSLLKKSEPISSQGSCITCGRRDAKDLRLSNEIPLIGTGKFTNFFPHGVKGFPVCPACVLAIQFSPLIMYSSAKLLLVHSDSQVFLSALAERLVREVRGDIAAGCVDEGYKNPKNALFHLIDLAQEHEERCLKERFSITAYHFSNWIREATLELFHLPHEIISFLATTKRSGDWNAWREIEDRGFIQLETSDDRKTKRNLVHERLLNNKSIFIPFFMERKGGHVRGNWSLLNRYLKEVRHVKKERLEAVKEIADRLCKLIKVSGTDKIVKKLEYETKDYRSFREVLGRAQRDWSKQDFNGPLFTLDEFNALVPDVKKWRESRDFLLYRIYEKKTPNQRRKSR